jgi:hypothetical protein
VDAVEMYLYAFAAGTVAFFATTIALIIAAWSKSESLARASLFLLLYAGATFVSMIHNLVGVYRLYMRFETLIETESRVPPSQTK